MVGISKKSVLLSLFS